MARKALPGAEIPVEIKRHRDLAMTKDFLHDFRMDVLRRE